MQQRPPAFTCRHPRTLTATLIAAVGAILMVVGVSAGTVAGVEPTQTIPLSNDSADVEDACPDTVGDYWHFVLAPNDDTFEFVVITLNLGDATFIFSGSQIIPNGAQLDNVFVAVPFEYDLYDLVFAGSSADVTPATGAVKFVLSHLCDGYGSSTTTTAPTTTVADTTTTAPTTSAPTTTVADTTTTAPTTTAPTTTVADTTTTTTGGQGGATTTTTTGGQGGATTTTLSQSSSATTTTIVGQSSATTTIVGQSSATTTIVGQSSATTTSLATRLPATGSGSTQPLTLIGGVLTLLGAVMFLSTRRLDGLD